MHQTHRSSLVIPDYPRGIGKTTVIKKNSLPGNGSLGDKNKKNDDLFQIDKTHSSKSAKNKKKTKKLKLTAGETNILGTTGAPGDGDLEKGKEIIETLSYGTIAEGVLSLGQIVSIRDSEILISLPGRLVGSVPITSISTPYTRVLETLANGGNVEDTVYGIHDLFSPGQIVIVAVTGVSNSDSSSGTSSGPTRITLSLNPKDVQSNWSGSDLFEDLVLTGAIQSREDHGYVVDLGISGTSAFLPLGEARGWIKGHKVGGKKEIGIGQILPVRIKSLKFSKNDGIQKVFASLTATPQEIGSISYTLSEINNPNLVLPGMKSEGTIMEANKYGLRVDFLDQIGEIHRDHLSEMWSNPESGFDIGDSIHPRVLLVRPMSPNPLSLTLQSFICNNKKWAKVISGGAGGDVDDESSEKNTKESVKLGEKYKVKIRRFDGRGITFEITGAGPSGARGIVTFTRCSDDGSLGHEEIEKKFPIGTFHDCRILEYSGMDNMYIGSFQKSILDMPYVRLDQLSIGQIVPVTLLKWKNGGAIVGLGKIKGFIPLLHFGDGRLSNPSSKYPVGSKFNARVFQIDLSKNQIKLTAKKSLVKSTGALIHSWTEYIKPGTVSEGLVSRVSSAGLNVFTLGGLAGFIPTSKAIRNPTSSSGRSINPESIFYPGQVVRFKVVNTNKEKKRLILSLFVDEDEAGNEISSKKPTEDISHTKKKRKAIEQEPEPIKSKKQKKAKAEVEIEIESEEIQPESPQPPEVVDISIEDDTAPLKSTKKSKNKKKKNKEKATNSELSSALSLLPHSIPKRKRKLSELSDHSDSSHTPHIAIPLRPKKRKSPSELPSLEDAGAGGNGTAGSFFNLTNYNYMSSGKNGVDENNDADELLSSEEEDGSGGKDEKSKANKKLNKITQAKIREQEIRSIESTLADPETAPKSVDDFERLVLASPNSSIAWTAYISFFLQLADIENARKIGRRALSTILFRETIEIENVWKVLLRMEGMFGSEEELQNLFKEALRANDELPMYTTLCEIYDHHGKFEELKKLFNIMTKKFKYNVKVWSYIIRYYYKKGQLDDGRDWFKSGLNALGQNSGHLNTTVQLISSTAVLEFTYGDIERGKTILDSTLQTSPKRLDLWILYGKQLVKKGQIDEAREVYVRGTTVPFPPKRMSQLLKEFLSFESTHGSPEQKEKVKEIALTYVKNIDVHL